MGMVRWASQNDEDMTRGVTGSSKCVLIFLLDIFRKSSRLHPHTRWQRAVSSKAASSDVAFAFLENRFEYDCLY